MNNQRIKNKRHIIFAVALLMIITFAFVFSQASTENVYAAEQSILSIARHDAEIRSLTHAPTIDEDFENDRVIVILNHQYSRINGKISLKDFQGVSAGIEFESVEDKFRIADPEQKSINRDTFRQILSLKLKEKSKENVLKAINELEKLDNVLVAHPSYIYGTADNSQPIDTHYAQQWGLTGTHGIQAENAWNSTIGDVSVTVGIMEGGIQADHDDLDGKVVEGNFTPGTGLDAMHGTHVAGIIGATMNNNTGISGIAQTSIAVLSRDDLVATLAWATNNDIRIINASYYYTRQVGGQTVPALANPDHRQALEIYDGIFIASAGNSGRTNLGNTDNTPQYPSGYGDARLFPNVNNVISVGSLDNVTTANAQRSDFSNFGANSVHIYAPGGNILSTFPEDVCENERIFLDSTRLCEFSATNQIFLESLVPSYGWDFLIRNFAQLFAGAQPADFRSTIHHAPGYHFMNGTSMAAPHVSGVAALLLAANPDLTPVQLRSAVLNSADITTIRIPNPAGGNAFEDQIVRQLNAYEALKWVTCGLITDDSTVVAFSPPADFNGYLEIPAGVTYIDNSAFFYGHPNLTSITLAPNSRLTAIEAYAFMECTGLTSFTIPNNITYINWAPFIFCNDITMYVERTSRPTTGWDQSWNVGFVDYDAALYHPVIWGVTLSQDRSHVVSFAKSLSSISNPNARGISAPHRKGYTFKEWNTKQDGTGTAYTVTQIASAPNNIRYYAIWTPKSYTVTYRDIGGGSFSGTHGTGRPTTHTYDKTTNLVNPTKTGHTFGGWFTNSSGNGLATTALSATGYTSDITLYAKWTSNTYTIIYRDVGDTAFSGTHATNAPTTHTYGTATALVSPTKTGYTFLGWFTNSGGTGTAVTSISATGYTSNITLYAKWTNVYTITYRDVGNTTFSGTHEAGYPTTHTYGMTTYLDNPIKTGYTFDGWFLNSDGTGTAITSLSATGYTSNITLYAKWIPKTYTITYRDIGDTAFSGTHGTNAPNTHTYGTATALVNPTKADYTFVGWFTNSDGTGTAISSLSATGYTSNITLYAKWTNTFTITYRDVGNTTFSGIHETGYPTIHTYGTITYLDSPTKTNYTFGGWYTNSSGNGTAITSLSATGYTSDITLYAKWNINASISIWDGSIAGSFAGGNGTESDPYQISTGAQLARMASEINAGRGRSSYYVLTNNIYLNDPANWEIWKNYASATAALNDGIRSWTRIATFQGSLDGRGYAIKGIYINTASSYEGLISFLDGGIVKNLGIEQSYIRGVSYIGSIAGRSDNGAVITNCYNTGFVDVNGGSYAGGIVGLIKNSTIINNYNTGIVGGNSGGIVGSNSSGTSTVEFNYFLKTSTINSNLNFTRSGTVLANNRTFDTTGTLKNEAGTTNETLIIGGTARVTLLNALNAAVDTSGILPALPSGMNYLHWSGSPYPVLDLSVPPTQGLKYTLINSGTAYEVSKGTANTNGTVVIPASYNGLPVTSIASSGFSSCSGLTSIIIPNSITKVGQSAFSGTGIWNSTANNSVVYASKWAVGYRGTFGSVSLKTDTVGIADRAFSNFSGLTSVTIPSSITRIGAYAFYYCRGLTNITFESNSKLTDIGSQAFEYCNLLNFMIPSGVTSIKSYTFSGNANLTTVTFMPGSQLTTIDNNAFGDCSKLTSINIPNGVTNIGDFAFRSCNGLISLDIPASVTIIGRYAFNYCTGLSTVTFAAGSQLKTIDTNAFGDCYNLTNITIPSNVTSIAVHAFTGCKSLTNIDVSAANNTYSSLNGVLFNKAQTTLVRYPQGKSGTYTIPDSVTIIADSAFRSCSNLTSEITLPNGATSIGTQAFRECSSLTKINISATVTSIGDLAFYTCRNFTAVNVDAANTVYSSIDGVLFNKARTKLLYYPDGKIGAYTIPSSVTIIGTFAFADCNSLNSLTIPDSVTSIETSAFAYCTSLSSIIIPASVKNLGSSVFSSSNIAAISFAAGSQLTSIGSYVFGDSRGLKSINIPDSVTSIGDSAFYGCYNLTAITIPDNVTYIGYSAFYGCSSLTAVNFGEGSRLEYIGDSAFSGCCFTEIAIPDSVTYIGYSAFVGCGSLTAVNFGEGSRLEYIGEYAFSDCYSILEISIPGSVTYIGGYAFQYWQYEQTIYIEDINQINSWDYNWNANCYAQIVYGHSLTATPGLAYNLIYDDYGNPGYEVWVGDSINYGYTFIVIPEFYEGLPVTKIADYGFYYCYNMTGIIIPSSVTRIGEYAFYECHNLTSVIFNGASQLESIEPYTFYNCHSLASINIPGNVTAIRDYAFHCCCKLRSITMPLSVTYIEHNAFAGCYDLTIYAETAPYPGEWHFLWFDHNYSIIWECTLSPDKDYVVSIVISPENIYYTYVVSAPCRTGYYFGGWTSIQGSDYPEYMTEDIMWAPYGMTLYAIWIQM